MKHINLTQMLQGCSKKNGMTVSASGSDGAQTCEVKRQTLSSKNEKWSENEALHSTCLRSALVSLSFRSRYLRYAAVIFCVLAMSVGQAWGANYYILSGKINVPLTKGMSSSSYQVVKSDGSTLSTTTDISGSITNKTASVYYNGTSVAYADLSNLSNYSTSSGENRTIQAIKIESSATLTITLNTKTFSKMDVIYRCESDNSKSLKIDGKNYNTSDKKIHIASIEKSFSTSISIANESDKNYDVIVILTESSGKCTLSYDANGGTGSMPSNDFASGTTVYAAQNAGFTAPSGKIFKCWNTKADGSGTSYGEWASFTLSANTTLYAQWITASTSTTYCISLYNLNVSDQMKYFTYSGSSDMQILDLEVPDYQTEKNNFWVGKGGSWKSGDLGNSKASSANERLQDLCFKGNRGQKLGTGSQGVLARFFIYDNSTYNNLYIEFTPKQYSLIWGSGVGDWTPVKLYPSGNENEWTSEVVTLTNDNISSYNYYVGILKADNGVAYWYKSNTLSVGSMGTYNKRTTTWGGNVSTLSAGAKGFFRMWQNATDYDNWRCHFVPVYTLSYNANEGSGAPANAYTATEGDDAARTLKVSMTEPTRNGYSFEGWATSSANASSGKVAYAPGASITLSADQELWAVWSCIVPDAPTADKISVSDQCQGTGVTFTANTTGIPSYVTWYWQDAANGTSTTNSAASGITSATSPGTYTMYLRAKNTVCGEWSDAASTPSESATVKTAVTAAWSTAPADGTVGGSMTASVTTNYSAGLRFSSSDATVASVNETSGVISYLKAGTTTITATVTGEDSYCSTASVNKSITVSAAAPGDGCWDPANDAADKLTSGDVSLTKFENNFAGVDGITSVTIQSKGTESAGQCSGADEKTTPSGYMKVKNASSSGNKIITIVLSAAKDITIGGQQYGSNTGSFYLVSSTCDTHLAECTTGETAKASNCPAGTYYVYATAEKQSINFSLLCIEDHAATYTVSASVNPSGYGSLSASNITDVTSGTAISASSDVLTVGASSITATPAATTAQYTYAFNNWTWTPAGETVTSDVTATANFTRTARTYTVTLNKNGGTINADNVENYTYGVGATLPTNMTKDDYRFMGWYDNEGLTGSAVTTIANDATGNKTYWAKWAQVYTITNGTPANGTITISKSSAIEGEAVSIFVVANTGYTFNAWNIYKTVDAGTTVSPTEASASTSFTMPAYNVTVDATFNAKTYTISYNRGTNGSGTKDSESKTHGVSFTLPGSTFTYAGHAQDGWATSDGGSKDYNLGGSYTTDAAQEFFPHWKCNTPTITDNGDNTVSITVPTGTTVRYTTDGTTPTSSTGTVYSSPFSIVADCTVKAIAYQSGCTDSEVASRDCTYSGGGGELTALVSGTLYKVEDMVPSGTVFGEDDVHKEGLSANTKFFLVGSASSNTTVKFNNKEGNRKKIDETSFTNSCWFGGGASLTDKTPTTKAIKFELPSAGTLYIYYYDNNDGGAKIKLALEGEDPCWSSTKAAAKATKESLSAGTYYLYATKGSTAIYGLQFDATDDKTEPTVTWSGVPATVYPGQQFVFTVETNTDATLNVSNLAAANATLVNSSIEGGVFTATAQIAADAAATPTFTLSTAEGTTYAAKVDTKSDITLGSCESSSGTATLFAFTCTSTTTAINTYSATGGTATLSGSAMSDKITIDKIDYYKFNSSSQWTMALTSGTFAAGDVITFRLACNTGNDKTDRGVKLNGSIAVTTDYPANTAQTSSYTVLADDGIAGQSSFTIKRNDSDIKFGTVTVTRAGQSLDNKQETTIEWPETVDGVRVVEYDPVNPNIPSLAIISSIGEATYTSNNEDVGSFRDGNVELTGGYGNVTITVSVAAVGCMEAAESSYVLTVTPKRYSVEKGTITGTGCDVTLSDTSVSSGEAVTLTPVPADGYSLTSWDVYKKDDSNTMVTVTNNRFTMPDYDVVVNATFTAKSTVATLSALSVTNADTEVAVTLSPAFASSTTAYTATLSCGTTSAPRISATKTDSKATTRLTNVSNLKGDEAARTATIVVTAEDGVTTQTYRIVFTVSAEDCVRLAPSITSISEGEDICSGGMVDLSVTAESRNNDGGTLSYQWQKYNGASWDNIAGATAADYTTEAITVSSKFRCVVTDTKDEDVKSTTSDEIIIGVTSVATPTYSQSANVVTLSCATEGATIWYSTDGNDPAADADNSRQGTSVSITRSGVTVKAIAYLEGCRSAVRTLKEADYSSEAVAGSITWAMTNAGKKEEPKFNVTCVPNTVLSAATAFTMRNDADYEKSEKTGMSVKISGITSYSADGKHVSLNVTVADGYTFTPSSLSVRYQPVSKAAKYKAVIGSYTSTESESVSAGSTDTKIVTFSAPSPSPISGTETLHIYVYGTDLTRWRLAGDIILYGTVQTTGTTYYSVTYNRNGATSGTVPQDDNLYENGDEVELAANTGNLAKTGYIFSGWSTTPGGTALTENPTITEDMTLYAVWTEDESAQTEACANVTTSGTKTSIAVGDYTLYFSSSNTEYNSLSVKSSTANKCDGTCRYYMPGVVVALTNSNASTIKLKGQQDYDVTVSKVMVADALDGAWREISYTPIAYSSSSCGVLGISGVQIAQGKYVFMGFTGGAKDEFRISGLCITPFTDPCPSISIVNNPVGDTWAKDATGVQISVGATTTSGTLSYQWQVSSDNTNFSDIDAATATTYNVPTGTVGTKYYRCEVSNGSCSKNSESAKMVIVEPTVTALYDYWYIKQSRQTPDIALFEVTKGTPASNVTIPAAEIGKYGFVYNTSDYKIYLQGSAPSAIYSDEDVEVTASIKSNSNADNITLHLLRATPHPQLAFVVTGDKGAGFENYNTSQITSDLYNQLALEYVIQPTNVYHTTDEKAIRAYYSQFDIILNTDYPDTQKGPNGDKSQWNVGYVNALGAMVDIVPILTMEAFVSRLPNWKIKNDPKSPSTNQYSMLLNCRAHEIFSGIPAENMGTEYINGEEHKVVTIVDENDYDTKQKALQGFAAEELADMDVVGQIHNGDGQLMACVERQYETTARMMVLGVNSSAMEKLTEDGIKVVKNALIYLLHKSSTEVNDCSLRFDNTTGDGKWTTAGNWAPAHNMVPTYENKVIILTDCELDGQAHVDMVKINEDVKLTIKPTGALIVDGTITRFSGEDWLAQDGNITSDNLVVEADDSNTGALILSNPDSKVGAKVQMYSKARYDNVNSKDLWQFVAIPIVSASRWNMGDWAYVFNNSTGSWDYYRDIYAAFDGIGVTQDNPTTYTFQGPLASTKTQEITLYSGNGNDDRTLIGNSWTAPIQIVNFDESKDFGEATPTVYVYNTGYDAEKGVSAYAGENTAAAAGSWYTIPIGSAKSLIEAGMWESLTEIPAMQTFEVQNTSGANTTLKLDYDALVRKNASSLNQNTPMYAPRRANNNVEIPSMRITLVDEATRSDVYLLKADRFTNGFEGGWDGDYRVDDDADYTQFYIVQETGKLAISAQPEMDGTFLGFVAGRNASYTITFRYNGNEELYFNDLEMQQSTLITDENEYTFMAERGEKGNRFLIGGRLFGAPEITTGVTDLDAENLDVQKVIYNDKLYIIRGGKVFSADGQLVK